jgi:hypothetical protein
MNLLLIRAAIRSGLRASLALPLFTLHHGQKPPLNGNSTIVLLPLSVSHIGSIHREQLLVKSFQFLDIHEKLSLGKTCT